jgi:thiol-disulfide isomerase/thioredoxin
MPGSEHSEEPRHAPAWLGVELALRPRDEPGVLVRAIVPGSPAERAGLVAGDIIMTLDGESVARPAELIAAVGQHAPGQRVAITFLRGGAERLLAATLDELPDEEQLLRKRYVDEPAPALAELKTVQGSLLPELRPLRGKVVLIEFWATWCVPCRLTAPLLTNWSDRHGAEGLAVLGITSDPVSVAAQGAREVGMSYAVFSDESGVTTRAYRAFALPTMFVIDRRGTVRDVMVGFSSERLREFERLVLKLLAER